jgi:hypothetical protein
MRALRGWVVAGWLLGMATASLSLTGLSGCGDSAPADGAQAKSNIVEQKKAEDGMKEFMANKKQAKKK